MQMVGENAMHMKPKHRNYELETIFSVKAI